jgi:hypothetical protein
LQLVAAAPDAAATVSRVQADVIALSVLQPQTAGGQVRLYRLPRPLGSRAHVDQAGTPSSQVGPARFGGKRGARYIRTPLSRKSIGRRAWLYWEDLAPSALFAHPSVLLLIDARNGRVLSRRDFEWRPLVNRRNAAFMAARAAADPRYLVYANPAPAARRPAPAPALQTSGATTPGTSRSCIVASGDFGEPLTAPNFAALRSFAKSALGEGHYYEAHSLAEIGDAIARAQEAGCRDLVLYLNGNQGAGRRDDFYRWAQGLPWGPYVSLESFRQWPLGAVKTKILTADDLRGELLRERVAHPDLRVTLVVEACHSGDFPAAINLPGQIPAADQIVTSVGADQLSIGPPDKLGRAPSPFLAAFTEAAGRYLPQHLDSSLGDAIGATAPQVQQQVTAAGAAMVGGEFPQSPQFVTTQEASGQVLPPAGADCPPASAQQRICQPPPGKVLVVVSLHFMINPGATGTISVSPPGRDVTAGSPHGPIPDIVFYADPGTALNFKATPGPGTYFNGWQVTSAHAQCGPGSSTPPSCSIPVTAVRAGERFAVNVIPWFLVCPPPGAHESSTSALRDCPGLIPA